MTRKIPEIIARFLSGETSSSDETELNRWLGEGDENIRDFAESEKIWNAIEIANSGRNFDSGHAFGQFIFLTGDTGKNKPAGLNMRKVLLSTLRWAAICIMLLGVGAVTGYLAISHLTASDPDLFEVQVPAGSRSSLTLADGTTVWLNAGSRLNYSHDFGSRDRTVHLEGEGYFSVAGDHKHPFIVQTSELLIEALGTSFNVKSYPQEEIIQTTLVSGSIMVSRKNYLLQERGIKLEPNQQITYYRETEQLALVDRETEPAREQSAGTPPIRRTDQEPPRILLSRGIDHEIFTSWKDNRLIFDNEPFESIAVKLERRFGARIIIQDEEIKNKRFKGRFDEITIEQALTALKFASPFEFYIKHDTIYITSVN